MLQISPFKANQVEMVMIVSWVIHCLLEKQENQAAEKQELVINING